MTGDADRRARSAPHGVAPERPDRAVRPGDSGGAPQRGEWQSALFHAVLDNLAEGIFVTDSRCRIIAVNPAFSRITGYAFAEVAGRRPDMFTAPAWRAIRKGMRDSAPWQGEVRSRTKAGEARPQWLSIVPVHDEHGAISNYVGIFSDQAERRAAQDRVAFLEQHDSLTGLPNRHLLDLRLAQAIASAGARAGRVALLLLDLDRFKVVVDSLGHRAGDLLLCRVAARLAALAREEDTVARVGGDEFVVVVPHGERVDAADVAQRIIRAMAEPYDIDGAHVSIGVSVGISLSPADTDDPEKLIRNADNAVSRAKAQGGNGYAFYTPNMTSRAIERMTLENSLRRGLAENEFILFYQPKVDLGTRRVVGAEALLRWSHPELGVVPPEKFIPVAEETGLIVEIGDWVLRDACAQNKKWQQQGLPRIPVSVNVCGRQFSPELIASVRAALSHSALEPHYLELELTESTLMSDVAALLRELKALGVQLSIDDFGTGYSSLGYLKRFPIDTLKIDRSLIADIAIGDRNTAIAGAAISLAHSLNLKVTAEGVEAGWQARYLRERGCDWVQGFYFGRPLPANKFATLLRQRRSARLGPAYLQ